MGFFAGTNGFLDEIPAEAVERFEKELLEMMDVKHADLLLEIARKKQLGDDLAARLKDVLTAFTASFKNSLKG